MVDAVRELDGKVAIVTGSTRNIGRATAEELARAGAAVVINGKQSKQLCEEVAHGIESAGGKALPYVADISDPAAAQAMVDAAAEAFGGVDILVSNASWRSIVPFEELDWDTWVRARSVALDGCFIMAKAVTPQLIDRGGGSIVGLGGMGSTMGKPGRAHAMATKQGMGGLIRGIALDLAKYGVRANVVVVGNFETIREGSSSVEPAHLADTSIPLGRKGEPQDIADLIRFIVGPGASYITGQTIHCNGGAYLNL